MAIIALLKVIQTSVLCIETLVLYFVLRRYPGVHGLRSLIVGTLFMAFGIGLMLFVYTDFLVVLAAAANPLFVLGLFFVCHAILLFFAHKPNLVVMVSGYIFFLFVYFFYLFAVNQMLLRVSILCTIHGIIFFYLVYFLLTNPSRAYHRFQLVFGISFLILGAWNLVRLLFSVNLPLENDYAGLGISFPLTFIIYTLVSIVWTATFIGVVRYRNVLPIAN